MNKGLKALEAKVLDRGQCAACGACLSLCPYLKPWQGRVVKMHDCDLAEGRCFAYCPRTEVDLNALHGSLFGRDYAEVELGPFRMMGMARARSSYWKEKTQNGGVVSSLVDLALKEGIIQAAILTEQNAELLPQGRIVKKREEVLSCAGSSYVSGPTLEALNRGPWTGDERIGVVGLPCQVLALARMNASPIEKRTPIDRVNLVVGLFCTWALTDKPFLAFLKKRFGSRTIGKLDITPPPNRLLKVMVEGESHQIPLDEIRPFIRPSCQVCIDMTSEFADISIGSVEGEEGWNTVIVRTGRGERLISRAAQLNVLEMKTLPEEKQAHLREASLLKKKRGLEALRKAGESYLSIGPDLVEKIEKMEVNP